MSTRDKQHVLVHVVGFIFSMLVLKLMSYMGYVGWALLSTLVTYFLTLVTMALTIIYFEKL